MLNVRKCVSATPKDDCDAIWLEHTQDAVANTSATAYFFARDLYRALDIPIGIIVSAWGGTLIEPWMSRDVFEKDFKQYDLSFLDGQKLPDKSQYKPCTLFNGMVHPLIPYTIKGWIWYQGESNRDMYQDYAALQTAYAAMMREKWGNPKMPFYFVQIAPYAFKGKPKGETAAMLMEAQAKSLETIPYSGMATTADIGEEWCIHPAKKQEVGRRLALMALKKDYGLALDGAFAPQYDRMEIREDGKIILYFKNNDCGIGPVNENHNCFMVAGEDRVFYPATGRVMKGYDTIEVTCPAEVANPVAVRYAFGNYIPGILKNGRGVAVAPFRTDNWPENK
jgi:sialate O-acetylesterase